MRRAKKEGRWMGTAPIGYVNRTTETGKKHIVPKEPQASIIKCSFNEISEGKYSTEQIWKRSRELGLTCSKHNFWLAIRNPVYCGKIVIPEFEDEQRHMVTGLHEPLISESLFYEVQNVLDGRKKNGNGTKIVTNNMLALRGFLLCFKCPRTLSGSASKGRYQHYLIIIAHHPVDAATRPRICMSFFVARLKEFVLNPGAEELFKRVILDPYSSGTSSVRNVRKDYIDQITDLSNKITRARELQLNGDIDSADYKTIKSEAEQKISTLEAQLSEQETELIKTSELEKIVNQAMNVLTKLDVIYWKSTIDTQREIIGSIYPPPKKKFTFENLKDRTTIVSDPFKIIYLINKELSANKNGTSDQNLMLSRWVLPKGQFSNQLIEDLRRLARLDE